jgi:predicted nucleic acid-binding protein
VIVVDTNVIAYCWLRGARTAAAQRVRLRDPDWHVPVLWRSEMCSVLAGYLRKRALALEEASAVLAQAEAGLAGREHLPSSALVLELVAKTRLSAYDCEFVALAQALGVPLVTEDAAILDAFPGRAIALEAFLRSPERPPPGAHSRRAAYRARAHHAAGSTR